jgi:hypothetical protein
MEHAGRSDLSNIGRNVRDYKIESSRIKEGTDHTFQKKCPATTDVFDKFKGGKHCDTFS